MYSLFRGIIWVELNSGCSSNISNIIWKNCECDFNINWVMLILELFEFTNDFFDLCSHWKNRFVQHSVCIFRTCPSLGPAGWVGWFLVLIRLTKHEISVNTCRRINHEKQLPFKWWWWWSNPSTTLTFAHLTILNEIINFNLPALSAYYQILEIH